MKTLIFILASLFTANVMASTGKGYSCSMQGNYDKNSLICDNSLLSDDFKLANNCPAQVKQKAKKEQTVQ